jgi:hypothetical protein
MWFFKKKSHCTMALTFRGFQKWHNGIKDSETSHGQENRVKRNRTRKQRSLFLESVFLKSAGHLDHSYSPSALIHRTGYHCGLLIFYISFVGRFDCTFNLRNFPFPFLSGAIPKIAFCSENHWHGAVLSAGWRYLVPELFLPLPELISRDPQPTVFRR